MRHIDKCDAQLIFQADQLILHVLPELEVEGAQRLVQKKDLRLIDDGARYCDPLLLSARQRIRHAVLISVQIDQLQRVADLVLDIGIRLLADTQTEGDVLRNGHMRKQRVFLKNRIQLALVGRKACDILAVKDHLPGIRRLKSAQDTERSGLPAARRPQERQEFIFPYIEIQVIQDRLSVK